MRPNQITQDTIGCAIEVHRHLGPGLLESAYEVALCRELYLNGVSYQRQKHLPLQYKGIDLEVSYRVDILVAETVVVEVKAVEKVLPIHEAQLLTYLKLGSYQVGLLLNFNVPQLRDGIVRKVLGLQEE
jgi:GxxExxY protein